MASIMFLSLYNEIALGARLLSAILREQGHVTDIVLFKSGKGMDQEMALTQEFDNLYTDIKFDLCLHNWKVSCYNYSSTVIQPSEYDLLDECVQDIKPDIVALTSMSYFVDGCKEVMIRLRRLLPSAVFVSGGYGPTFDPDPFLDVCDYVFTAECETAFPEFVTRLDRGLDVRETPNIVYRKGHERVHNKLCPIVTDLDSLPFPDFKTGNIRFIENRSVSRQDPVDETYYIMTGRGCPGKCTYCSTSVIRTLYTSENLPFRGRRMRSMDNIFAEMAQAKQLGYTNIFFEDSYLVAPKDFMYAFFKRYKKEVSLPFFAYLHYAQVVNEPGILDAAIDAGMNHTVCAVQHTNEKYATDLFGRNVKSTDIRAVAQMLIDRHIPFHYDFITDNPIESEEDFDEQLNRIPEYPFSPSFTNIGVARLRCFPQTPLTKRVEAQAADPFADVSWLYKGLLIVSRFLLDDKRFNQIRNDAFLKDHPVLFLPMVRSMWARKFIESGEPVMLTDMEMMRTVYEYYTKRYLGKPIIVWGTSGRYRDLQFLFKRNVIIGFIDNDPAKQNTQIDGMPVYGPAFLHQHTDLPVFICTMFKKDVVRQIREQFGQDIMLP